MMITDIKVYPVQAPGRTFVPVVVETDTGLRGIGEAGLQRRPLAIAGAIEHLKRFLIGEDPSRIEHLWQRMFRGGFYPADRVIGSALSAIDMALWDLKGKRLKVPVYELLGGLCRDYVECYTHTVPHYGVNLSRPTDADQLVEISKRSVAEMNNRFVRLAPSSDGTQFDAKKELRRLLEHTGAVRNALGGDVEILIDLHCRFDPEEAIRFCREVEQFRPYFIEDPIRVENRSSYRHLRRHVSVPLAAGEHCSSKWEFREWIEEELIDYARIDLCIAGGLSEAKKIAGWCETHYIKVVPHNPLGPISTAAGVHLDFAISNFGVQEIAFLPGTMLPDVFPQEMRMQGNRILPPTAPGLGVEFDCDKAKEHPFEFTEPEHYYRPDGSFTNQ